MSRRFASGKKALAICDRCGLQYKLRQLKILVVRGRETNIKVCPTCYDPDHPQNKLGEFPVDDPQAIRNPRPDVGVDESRITQYGFSPVGGGITSGDVLNNLVGKARVGKVTVETS
jgi:hypothetical protein